MSLLSDLRVAFRTLARTPAFFAMTTAVLALGVAAVVVMFGFLRIVMAPPPLERVDRVFSLTVMDALHQDLDRWVRLHDIEDWNREQRSFEDGVAGMGYEMVLFRRQRTPAERLAAGLVTGPLFSILRVRPVLGRNLSWDDAQPGAAPVVVVSERLWRTVLGASPAALGESVRVNGEPYTVVGVAPAAFDLPGSVLLWIPDRTDSAFTPRLLAPTFLPVGRLRDGVTPEMAGAELRAIQERRIGKFPEVAGEHPQVRPFVWMVVEYQRLFHVLFGSALLVLALACVNAAGLLLVRGAGRAHEAAVRRALGAGRLRLVSQMLAEAAVIGAATALISLTLAEGAAEILRRVVPTLLGGAPMWWRFALDGPSVLLALGAALVTTLGAGLVPAVRAARVSIDPLLRDGQRDTGLHASHLVRWLVVAEIALSSALLSAAGLVIRSGANLGEGDVGVPTAGFLISFVDLPPRYQERGQRQFIQELTERLDSIPGVESASISTSPPGCTPYWNELYTLGARSPARMEELPSVGVVQVTPGFFESFRIPVQGRTPLNSDAWGRPTVAVVSESLARSAWPGEDAIGKEIRIAPQEGWLPWATVVGVAKDVRYDERLRAVGTMPPVVYISMLQWPTRQLTVALRAARNPAAAAEKIRQAVWSIDPDVPVSTARSLDDQRRRNAARLTLIGRMFMAFGAVTLALAATGVYGVLAHSVAQRERELAIRRALGASGVHLALAVLLRSGWQLLLGLALGLALAPTMGAMVGSALGQPGPSLRIYLGVAVGLSVVLGIAALIPVRRALSLDPSAALRQT